METQQCFENKGSEMTVSQNMFTRDNMLANENKIRLVDSDEETGLELFCYNRCSQDESDFIKQCRGLVFHNENLVMKAFSYTDEYSHTDVGILGNIMSNFKEWTFYNAYEGALLRLFYFSGKWFLSTHRKLNAFRSKWASRESFGTLFKRALEYEILRNTNFAQLINNANGENTLDKFQSTLNPNMQYMFLLRNCSENRIVCVPPTPGSDPMVFHVGTFINNNLSMSEDTGLCYPSQQTFLNMKELISFVDSSVDPTRLQGLVCFGPNKQQLKILHSKYMEMFRVRGNEPSIKFRYLQVRMNKNLTDMLISLYPEFVNTFNEYESNIVNIAKYIYDAYVQRFIKKRYIIIPREEYQVMSACHSWHLFDRENNRINFDIVLHTLNKQSPTNINHMVKRFRLEQVQRNLPVPENSPVSQ